MTRCRLVAVVITFLLVAATTPAQDTTGRILVRTLDPEGVPLPGVTVIAASPALIGGARTVVTDRRGEALHPSLAPGPYTVSALLNGFVTQEREHVKVALGGTTLVTVEMAEVTFSGEVEVRADTPVVDPTQVAAEQVFDREYLRGSVVGAYERFYFITVDQTAGVADNRVMGSTIYENAWYIDGMDTSDPSVGTWSIGVVFDAVEEMEVSTAGFEAEYGRAMGGVVNLVTRSGGNDFSGTLDARYRDESFFENGDHYDRENQQESAVLVDATFGGPILRDRLWFFTALRWGGDSVTPLGAPVEATQKTTLPMAKLTWQVAPSWRATAAFSRQDVDLDSFNASRFITADASASREGMGERFTLELDAILGENLLWTLRGGRLSMDDDVGPSDGDLTTIAHNNLSTNTLSANTLSANFPGIGRTRSSRDELATTLSWFVSRHELKAGAELSQLRDEFIGCSTGRPDGGSCAPGTVGYVFNDTAIGGNPFPYLMVEETAPGTIDSSGELVSIFVQDRWRPHPSLTITGGVRWDRATYDNDTGARIADLELWQPRLGLAWDLSGDARTVVRASVGRFMDPKSLVLPHIAASRSATSSYWLSCSLAATGALTGEPFDPELCPMLAGSLGLPWRTDPEAWDPHGWFLFDVVAEAPTVTDPDLEPARADHLVLAVEHALWPRTSIELSWVSKRTDTLLQDTCNGTLDGLEPGHDCSYYVIANLPGLERNYDAAILRLESQTFDWLTVLASYTWSDSTGNAQTLLGNDGFDYYPWHWVNRDGYLSDHRRHRLKLNGYALLPWDFAVAFNGGWSSAFRWTPVDYDVPGMPYGVLAVEPRGSREGNDEWWLDLELSKGFTVGPVRLVAIASVLNLFSTEQVSNVCRNVTGCGGDIGLGDPIDWQYPRRWEVGLRVEF